MFNAPCDGVGAILAVAICVLPDLNLVHCYPWSVALENSFLQFRYAPSFCCVVPRPCKLFNLPIDERRAASLPREADWAVKRRKAVHQAVGDLIGFFLVFALLRQFQSCFLLRSGNMLVMQHQWNHFVDEDVGQRKM